MVFSRSTMAEDNKRSKRACQAQKNGIKERMKSHVLSFFVLLAIALSGCAPRTIQGLKEKPAGTIEFHVDEEYQCTYRAIFHKCRDKYERSMIGITTSHVDVDGELYADLKEGSIIIKYLSPQGYFVIIDVKALSDTRTHVTAYYVSSGWKENIKDIKKWITEGCNAEKEEG